MNAPLPAGPVPSTTVGADAGDGGARSRPRSVPPRRPERVAAHETLPDIVVDGPRRYRLVRAWPRGRDHALVELSADDGTTVAAQWFSDPAALAQAASTAPAPARVAGDVLLHPDGADSRLRALPGVLAENGARLVAHRPGRRAVVRLSDADGTVHGYAKVVRSSKAEDLARRAALVAELIGRDVTVPQLADESDLGRGVLRWSVVPGRTLHDLGAAGGWTPAEARAAWQAAGRATSLLHAASLPGSAPADDPPANSPPATGSPATVKALGPVGGSKSARRLGPARQGPPIGSDACSGGDLTIHTVADELGAIADWLGPAVGHGLLDADLVAQAEERVMTTLDTEPADAVLGVLHRDLHDKQLLLDDSGAVGMIDVDTLAVGERALDVANVLVHLELRQAQRLLAPELAAAARRGFLAGLTEQGPQIPADRVAAYQLATRLRLAGVYAYRPRWRAVAKALLHQAANE